MSSVETLDQGVEQLSDSGADGVPLTAPGRVLDVSDVGAARGGGRLEAY